MKQSKSVWTNVVEVAVNNWWWSNKRMPVSNSFAKTIAKVYSCIWNNESSSDFFSALPCLTRYEPMAMSKCNHEIHQSHVTTANFTEAILNREFYSIRLKFRFLCRSVHFIQHFGNCILETWVQWLPVWSRSFVKDVGIDPQTWCSTSSLSSLQGIINPRFIHTPI